MAEKRPGKSQKKTSTSHARARASASGKKKSAVPQYDMDGLSAMIAREVGIPHAQFVPVSKNPAPQKTSWPIRPQNTSRKRIMILGVSLFSIAIGILTLTQFSTLFAAMSEQNTNTETNSLISQVQEDLSTLKQEKEAIQKTTNQLKKEATAIYKEAQVTAALAGALKSTSTIEKVLSLSAFNTSSTSNQQETTIISTTTYSITP